MIRAGQAWQLSLPLVDAPADRLEVYSPYLAVAYYRNSVIPCATIDMTGWQREQAIERMRRLARTYEESGWRVIWLWKEAQDAIHERGKDSGVTP